MIQAGALSMHVWVGLLSYALVTKQKMPEAPEQPPKVRSEPNLHLGYSSHPSPAQSC